MSGGQGQGTQAADASGGDAATSASDPASYEETVVRIKDLKDLVLPLPPENAGQARGYVNQVLMAIGRLQKTTDDELYLWAQDCLTSSEEQLSADKRFPRTTPRDSRQAVENLSQRQVWVAVPKHGGARTELRRYNAQWARDVAFDLQAFSAGARPDRHP